ncbi:MAG: PKD domain-containing protein [Bacteroidota bacterium]
MKKKLIKIVLIIAVILIKSNGYNAQAQIQCSMSAVANDTIICPGDSVYFNATGAIAGIALSNNFNSGTVGSGWFATTAAQFTTNTCVPTFDGSMYLWMGTTSPNPRILESLDFNVLNGGTIQWNMIYSEQSGSVPCDGPDQADEGVEVQYSTNGGGTWNSFLYFQPDGNVMISNPHTSNVVTSGGSTAFTSWTTQTWPIPAAAMTASTRFRWFQDATSGADYDHWGVDNVIITSTIPSHVYWLPATGLTNDTILNPHAAMSATTTYTVWISNGIDSCYDNITIHINNIPTSSFSIDSLVCTGSTANIAYTGSAQGSATYNWNFNGGSIISGSGSGPYTVNWTTPGVYNVSLSVSEEGCLSQPTTIPIHIYQFGATISSSNPVSCYGDNNGSATAAINGGQGPVTYLWNTVPGQTGSTATGLSGGQSYYVIITDSLGCATSASIQLAQPTQLSVSVSNDTTVCPNTQVAISAYTSGGTQPYTYLWNTGNNTSTVNNVIGYNPQTFYVTVTDDNGCNNYGQIDVTPFQLNGSLTVDTLVQILTHNFIFAWTGDPCTSYSWDFGDGTTGTGMSMTHIFSSSGVFNVTLTTVSSEGCTYVYTIPIEVIYPSEMEIPNVFTPNIDVYNDVFIPNSDGEFTNYLMQIFNRWGNKIFESTVISQGWDGIGCSDGTYFYIIEASASDRKVYKLNGPLSLIR